jgi:hypothetical protein
MNNPEKGKWDLKGVWDGKIGFGPKRDRRELGCGI